MRILMGFLSALVLCNTTMKAYAAQGESQCSFIEKKITNVNCVLGPDCTAVEFESGNALARRQMVMGVVRTNLYAVIGPATYPAMSTGQDKKLKELGSALQDQNQINALITKINAGVSLREINIPESSVIVLAQKPKIGPSTKLSDIINMYSLALSQPCNLEEVKSRKS